MSPERTRILVTTDYYLPGYKGGGPMRTLVNMVYLLSDEFHFNIITADRDLGDPVPYAGIACNTWQPLGRSDVFYFSRRRLSLLALCKIIRATKHDALYLNSFFSPTFTVAPLLLRRFGLIPKLPVVLAPRGELSSGALALKTFKKRAFFLLARTLDLYGEVVWQASSEYEEKDIRWRFGDRAQVVVAPDLPALASAKNKQLYRRRKVGGSLKVAFLSRVSRMKNLDGALMMLGRLRGAIQLNIYGPLEDKNYWLKCQKIIESLPENIEACFRGSVAHDQVAGVLADHDLLLLPSLGENFGHVVLEALLAGCPVLISDRTPWRNLEAKGVGWDLPLEQPGRFVETLQRCVEMSAQEHDSLSQHARSFGLEQATNPAFLEKYQSLFRGALGSGWQTRQ